MVADDNAFAALFSNTSIVRATTSVPKESGIPSIRADLFWELADGTWLAMDTKAGYYAGELDREYWMLKPIGL